MTLYLLYPNVPSITLCPPPPSMLIVWYQTSPSIKIVSSLSVDLTPDTYHGSLRYK